MPARSSRQAGIRLRGLIAGLVAGLALLCSGGCGDGRTPAGHSVEPPVNGPVVPGPEVAIVLGPVLGAVTGTSASVWVQGEAEADVTVEYLAAGSGAAEAGRSAPARLAGESDFTATVVLRDLEPGACYEYRVLSNGRPETGDHSFCTFPGRADEVVVGLIADLDKRDAWPAPSIAELAKHGPDLLVILGDWDHRNPGSAAEIREMHRVNRSAAKKSGAAMREHFLGSVPVAYVWDDHDYGGNNSDRYSPLRGAALEAYRDYWPSYPRPDPASGVWQKFGYADLVEFFLLDLRSQRDPDTYRDPRFVPDYDPAANRETLRRDPDRSMLDGAERPEGLGSGQKAWLKQSLLTSPFPWKVIVSTVPWNATTVKDDAWWDFLAERQELIGFVRDNGIAGVIFVSGDIHTGGGIDDGTHADLPEMTIPSANLNETERGSPTCNLHPDPVTEEFATCGEWSAGLLPHGAGYGLLRLSHAAATLETHNMLGGSLTLTLPIGPPP